MQTTKKYRQYQKYKSSNIEWIEDIPEHWNRTTLKRLTYIKITDGPHETPIFLDEGIPFVSAEAIQNGTINFNDIRGHISKEQDKIYSRKCKPKQGDIFVVKSGSTTGKVAIVETDKDFNIWSPIALIRFNKMKMNNLYGFYFLQSTIFQTQVQQFWSFGTQPNVGMNVLENLWLAIPNIEEQKDIANFLDKKTVYIDNILDKKQRLIELLKEKRQTLISHAVTKGLDENVKLKPSDIDWISSIPEHWKTISVSNLIRSNVMEIQDGNHGELHPKTDDYVERGIPFIMANDIRNGRVSLSDCKFISKEQGDKLRIGFAVENDVLLTHKGTIGEVAILEKSTVPYVMLTPQVTYYRMKTQDLFNRYLYYYFQSLYFKNQMDCISSNQSTRAYVGIIAQKEFIIILPILAEQQIIAKFLDEKTEKIDQIVSKIELQIEKLKEYRQTLISNAVTGKIDVREAA